MTSWPSSRELTDDNSLFWRSFRTSLYLSVLGGFLLMIISRILESGTDVSVLAIDSQLIRSSLPIVSLVVAVMVLSSVETRDNHAVLNLSSGILWVWCLFTLALGSSSLLVDGLDFTYRFQLAAALSVYAVVSVVYFLKIIQVSVIGAHARMVLGLMLPGLVGSFQNYGDLMSPAREIYYQSFGLLLTVVVLVVTGGRLEHRMALSRSRSPGIVNMLLAFLTLTTLLGAVMIPVRMSLADKQEYLAVVSSSRLPLFAVTTFLLLSAPVLLARSSDDLRNVVTHRRLGLLSGFVSFISMAGFLAALPFRKPESDRETLIVLVALVAAIAALLLPWVIVRIREGRIDRVDGLLLLLFSSVVFLSRDDTFTWQLGSLIALLVLVGVLVVRHVRRAQPVLSSSLPIAPRDTPAAGHHVVSVVIPSYNPGEEVMRTVQRVRRAFEGSGAECQIVVVSDGSTDESVDLLQNSADVDLHIWMRTNHGKGAALREGFARCTGSVICFVDADGDLDPASLPSMVELLVQERLDIVYGSKAHEVSNVAMSPLRRFVSQVFRLLVRILFRFDVADTQTGIKAYSAPLIKDCLPVVSENGFNIDLELFVVAHALGYTRFKEHSVALDRRGATTVGFTTVFEMLFSTLRLFRRRTLTLDYTKPSIQG